MNANGIKAYSTIKRMNTLLTLILILISGTGYTQQITYKNLIGKWQSIDSVDKDSKRFYIKFYDSTHMDVFSDSAADKCIYQFAQKKDFIAINYTLEGLDQTFLIKLKSDTLRLQFSLNEEDLQVWQFPETDQNTALLVKEKPSARRKKK
jgi:hypothetical protein